MTPETDPHLNIADSRSRLYEKLDPALRRKLDTAIIDRTPPGYKALFETFNLAAHGVSYSALYFYARRLRTSVAMLELSRHVPPDEERAEKVLPDLIAQRLLEAALDESASPTSLHRLADCWRLISQTTTARQRLQITLESDRKRADSREISDLLTSVKTLDRVQRAALAQRAPRSPSQPLPPDHETGADG